MSKSGLMNSAARVLLAGAVLVSTGGLAAAGTLRIGHTTWVGYGPMYLARDLGYFKDMGLDVDLQVIEDSSLYMAAAAAGKLDGSLSTIDEIMKYRSDDFCFKAVYTLDDSYGGDGLLVQNDVSKIQDLKGVQVAMNEGSTSEFWFAYYLKQNGMTPDDVVVSNMSADDAAAAFMAGSIPAAVTWEPNLTLAKKSGKGKVLVDSTAIPGVIVDVVELSCDVIKNQPDDVKALVAGLNKANEYIKSNQEDAYKIMAKGVGGYLTDPKDFADSAKGVRFYDEAMNKEYMGTIEKPGPLGDLVTLGGEIWTGLGHEMKMKIDYGTIVDTSFVNP
jgi:NitT/TauT family transport system substrate-binding protein